MRFSAVLAEKLLPFVTLFGAWHSQICFQSIGTRDREGNNRIEILCEGRFITKPFLEGKAADDLGAGGYLQELSFLHLSHGEHD